MPRQFACPLALLALLAVTAEPVQAGYEVPGFGAESLSGSYLAGRFANKVRDMTAAARYFGNALEDDPNNPVLIERAFLLELSEGKLAEAEEYATRVLSFNGQHRMARIVLGLRDMRVRHYADARRNFAKMPVGELTSALLTAWAYAGESDTAQAFKALDQLDAANDVIASFKTFHAALIADLTGSPLRAEPFYAKAYEQAGSSLRIVQAYGNFLERTGRAAQARQVYDKFLGESEKNPLVLKALAGLDRGTKPEPFIATALQGAGEALFSLASAMSDDPGLDVALVYAQLALRTGADPAVARTLLGDIYEDMERYDQAVASYEAIARTSVLRANAEIEIAVDLQRLDRAGEAKARLEALIAREPRNYEAILTLGNLHRGNQEFAAAAQAYDKAAALVAKPQREQWPLFYYRGIAQERLKDWGKAEADFRLALTLAPDQPLVLNYLGYSMIEKKLNLAEAVEMVRKAVALKPNDGYIVDSLGWAHYQLGDYDEAVRQLERAVELKPADPVIADHLGDAYWRIGRTLEARFQWQHAKDNKPEPADLANIETKLKDGLIEAPPVKPAQNAAGGGSG